MKVLKKSEATVTAKKDLNLRIKEKREKIDAIFKGDGEPTTNPIDYKLSLIKALSWHNVYTPDKTKKEWVLSTIKDKPQRISLSKLDDDKFKQVGALMRIKDTDNFLEPNELDYISSKMSELISLSAIIEPKIVSSRNTISIQDKIKSIVDEFAAEIDGEIDNYISQGYPKVFAFRNSPKNLNSQAAKQIPGLYKDLISELEEVLAGTCEDLNDSYSKIKTIQVKRFLKLMQDFVGSCNQQVITAKKPKTVKIQPPAVIVKSLKFLPKYEELNLVSDNPIKIVTASVLILYDTVKRKISYYVAPTGEKLSVKGTTIIGFELESSGIKSVRKPEEIRDLSAMDKKQSKAKFESFSTKKQPPNGRTNVNEILLKIFK